MTRRSYTHLIILGLGFWITIIAYFWFASTPYFALFKIWAHDHLALFYLIIIPIKVIGLIWPPLPGGVFTIGSIPAVGWMHAYIADFIGTAIGSTLSYYIAFCWGMPFLKKILDQPVIEKIQKIKIVKKREFEAIFAFRLFGGNLFEIISYGAGLLRIRFSHFICATMVSHIVIGLPFFYFTHALFEGKNMIMNIIFIIGMIVLFVFLKDRYFEKDVEQMAILHTEKTGV